MNGLTYYAKYGILPFVDSSESRSFDLKPIEWLGRSRAVLREFPRPAKRTIGLALFRAQEGEKHPSAKPLKGYGGAGVVEVVEEFMGDAYRAVYTVKFRAAVYVLHVYQKKSKSGSATPPRDLESIERRLIDARRHYELNYLGKDRR